MLKLLAAALVLAQVSTVPPPRGIPMPMGPTPVEPAAGITVIGNGIASAAAGDATVTLRIATRNNALTLNAQSLAPIVDALVRAGADRTSVSLPPYLVGQARMNNASITAVVHHPTQQMLQQGMVTIANAFASMPEILLTSADVRLTADHCTALARAAAANAISNARSNAAFVAQQIGAKLGPAISVDWHGSGSFGGADQCLSVYSIGPMGAMNGQMSPADMLTVKVYSTVTMHYAIKH